MVQKKIVIAFAITAFFTGLFGLTACNTSVSSEDNNLDVGVFYNLQQAFDNELLTNDDLDSIAYYLNDESKPVYPDPVSAEIQGAIKETRSAILRAEVDRDGVLRYPNATTEDVTILGYYGKYNDSYAVMIADSFTEYTSAEWSETIDGVTFYYSDGNRILIWIERIKENDITMGAFYTLQKAFEEDMLALEDLRTIADYHRNGTSSSGELSIDIVTIIKEIAAHNMRESALDPVVYAKAEDFSITRYYGTYNASVVFMINDPYHEYPAEVLDINETIEGVLFHYTTPDRIVVWKK
jgi:hypothetical protein